MRSILFGLLAALLPALAGSGSVHAQTRAPVPGEENGGVVVSIVYTGRSLGALGVLRSQDEHELLTEQANREGLPFRLVSHMAWRAPGLAVFLPTDTPEGDELPALLEARATAQRFDSVRALRSGSALLVQDPTRLDPDMLSLLLRNPRTVAEFPDLEETRVTVYRLRAPRGERAFMIEEEGAQWQQDPALWTTGEMNRVNIAEARVFELPFNIGEIGPRAAVLRELVLEAEPHSARTLVVDLGHRDGDLGLARGERARIDYHALTRLGYGIAVPWEFELALGAAGLAALRAEAPGVVFLAANLRTRDTTLVERHLLVEVAGVRIGLFGLVDPGVRSGLPRSILEDFSIEAPVAAARRETAALRLLDAHAVVALSNLDEADNAAIAGEVAGIDAIVADLHARWSPEEIRTEVSLPGRPRSRPGSPALVARGFANGLGVGRLDLRFRRDPEGEPHLAGVSHRLASVTDRVRPDTALVTEVRAMARPVQVPKGELMFPSFSELTERHPHLAEFDETTRLGRVSKRMWEEFVARALRNGTRAEVAVIRAFAHFPPLIGKLHENEIRGWLWTEDEVVVLDIPGASLRRLLESDTRGELVASGMDRRRMLVMGRRLDDDAFYRVATTDVVFEGARAGLFSRARRVRDRFRITGNGGLVPGAHPVSLREYMLAELLRLRTLGRGDGYLDRIAGRVAPDAPYENLLVFAFERPTLWFSVNRAVNAEGYGSVRETRVSSPDAWVVGASGRFRTTYDRTRVAWDAGLSLAYARQHASLRGGGSQVSESADDIKLDLTFRRKPPAGAFRLQPFVRGIFDTEFSRTVHPVTGSPNPRQLALRGVLGLTRPASRTWRTVEAAGVVENDFGLPNPVVGVQVRTDARWPVAGSNVLYVLRNDATWFLPSPQDSDADLALRYNMVHELLIPLVDELSLSVALDVFTFQGKVPATRRPGGSMLLRVGITYDRIWKPRHQPLF
jgi:hypothetical protein